MLEASLVYRVSSTTARAAQRNTIFNSQKNKERERERKLSILLHEFFVLGTGMEFQLAWNLACSDRKAIKS